MKLNLNELFLPDENFKLLTSEDLEQENIKNNSSILGVVKGQFFDTDADSRNGRHYTKKGWEKVISEPELIQKINNGLMFGAIGHKVTPVSDEDLNKGEVSHKIIKLWIDENGRGMGIAYILDTPSGKNLFTYLKSGSKLYVSSRASGEFLEGAKSKTGLPIIDENTYYLDTFDFVLYPGFLTARPNILESQIKENNEMDEKTLKSAISEGFAEALKVLNLPVQKNENKNEPKPVFLGESLEKKFSKTLLEKLSKMDESEIVEAFETPSHKVIVSGEPRLVNYVSEHNLSNLAVFIPTKNSVKDINPVNNQLLKENFKDNIFIGVVPVNTSEKYGSKGIVLNFKESNIDLKEIKKVISYGNVFEGYGVDDSNLEKLKKFEALGLTPENIQDFVNEVETSLPILEKYMELGTIEELTNSMDIQENLNKELSKLGTIKDISKTFKAFEALTEKYKTLLKEENKQNRAIKAKNISERFSVNLQIVNEMLKTMNEKQVVTALQKLGNNKNEDYTKNEDGKPKTKEQPVSGAKNSRQVFLERYSRD